MKTDQEKLWDAVGMLDGETVQTAMTRAAHMQAAHTTRRATLRRRAVILTAACLILLIAGAFVAIPFMTADEPPPIDTVPPTDTAEQPTDTPPVTEDESREPVYVSGDFSTDIYNVTQKDGVSYLNFKDGNKLPQSGNSPPASTLGAIDFSSIEEMQRCFTTGDLTGEQIMVLKSAFPATEDGIQLPINVQNPDVPLLPEDYRYGGVIMSYRDCSISFSSSTGRYGGSAFFYDEKQYYGIYKYEYENYYENNKLLNVTLTSGEFAGIPCEIGNYNTVAARLRTVRFKIERDGKTISVILQYLLESYNGLLEESDTVPYSVIAFYEHGGKYGQFFLSDIPTEDTADWLASFGITTYSSVANTSPFE